MKKDKLKAINTIYYLLKPLIPRWIQLWLRSKIVRRKRRTYSSVWPILEKASKQPDGWPGWPDQKRFALVLTHDVETAKGLEKCQQLLDLENSLGFLSSFNFIPERYDVSPDLRNLLTRNGFEVGVHGLKHDGKLYKSKKIFQEKTVKINRYLSEWGCVGFRSPSMHHNLSWIHELTIDYDSSTFDTDPFEPQSDNVCTIFPFFVKSCLNSDGYVEIPYTLPQDFTLFILLKEKNISIWKRKLDWIVKKGGMVLLNTHPDYMDFNGDSLSQEKYPGRYYEEFLQHIMIKYKEEYWNTLPKDIAHFWATVVNT